MKSKWLDFHHVAKVQIIKENTSILAMGDSSYSIRTSLATVFVPQSASMSSFKDNTFRYSQSCQQFCICCFIRHITQTPKQVIIQALQSIEISLMILIIFGDINGHLAIPYRKLSLWWCCNQTNAIDLTFSQWATENGRDRYKLVLGCSELAP